MSETLHVAAPQLSSAQLARSAPLDKPVPRRPDACPVEDWLSFLGHRWNALVLWHLQHGPLCHQQLMARLPGITAKVLAERLAGLARRGLIEREIIGGFPRTVLYRLSARGQTIVPILDQIELWSKAAH